MLRSTLPQVRHVRSGGWTVEATAGHYMRDSYTPPQAALRDLTPLRLGEGSEPAEGG
jgi:hypothetical protein